MDDWRFSGHVSFQRHPRQRPAADSQPQHNPWLLKTADFWGCSSGSDRISRALNVKTCFGVAPHLRSHPWICTMSSWVGYHGKTISISAGGRMTLVLSVCENIFGVVLRTTPILWVRRTIVKQYSIKCIGNNPFNLSFCMPWKKTDALMNCEINDIISGKRLPLPAVV